MPLHNAKRVVDYTLETVTRLSDLRQIVAETQALDGTSTVEFPRFVGQREQEYIHLVITEEGKLRTHHD